MDATLADCKVQFLYEASASKCRILSSESGRMIATFILKVASFDRDVLVLMHAGESKSNYLPMPRAPSGRKTIVEDFFLNSYQGLLVVEVASLAPPVLKFY